MRLVVPVLVFAMGAVAHADAQPAGSPPKLRDSEVLESRAVVAAAPVKDPTRWRPADRVGPVADPRDDAAPLDGKSPVVSVVLPIAVTLAGIGVIPIVDRMEFEARGTAKTAWNMLGWTGIAAFVVGPSLGQIYAGNPWNTGLKIRLIGAAVIGTGLAIAATGSGSDHGGPTTEGLVAAGFFLLGAIPYVGGSIYEIATGPRSVRAHNEGLRSASITIVPVAPSSTLGLTVLGSF